MCVCVCEERVTGTSVCCGLCFLFCFMSASSRKLLALLVLGGRLSAFPALSFDGDAVYATSMAWRRLFGLDCLGLNPEWRPRGQSEKPLIRPRWCSPPAFKLLHFYDVGKREDYKSGGCGRVGDLKGSCSPLWFPAPAFIPPKIIFCSGELFF